MRKFLKLDVIVAISALLFLVIVLAVCAFAQDDEPPRLNPNRTTNLPQCVYRGDCKRSSATPIPDSDKPRVRDEWQRSAKAHGNKPVVVPAPKKGEENSGEWDWIDTAVTVGVVLLGVVLVGTFIRGKG